MSENLDLYHDTDPCCFPEGPPQPTSNGSAESAWRDMESAPQDGTEIIGKYGDEESLIFWSDDRT